VSTALRRGTIEIIGNNDNLSEKNLNTTQPTPLKWSKPSAKDPSSTNTTSATEKKIMN
jgi:hypothetical protein